MRDFFSLKHPASTPGKVVRANRLNAGLTLKELEKITGIAESNLSAIENDRTELGPERAYLIGAALSVDPEFILMPLGYEGRLQKRISRVRSNAAKMRADKMRSADGRNWKGAPSGATRKAARNRRINLLDRRPENKASTFANSPILRKKKGI